MTANRFEGDVFEMDLGPLPEEPLYAGKQLSKVEVRRTASNQHEFHAGSLRRILRFRERTTGPLTLIVYRGGEPIVVKTQYTLYDARENVEGRTEWRFYY